MNFTLFLRSLKFDCTAILLAFGFYCGMPLCVLFVETCMSFEVFTPTFSNAFVTGVPLWNEWQMVYEKQCCPKIFAFFTSSVTLLTTLSQFFFSICKNYSFIPFHTPELIFKKIQLL